MQTIETAKQWGSSSSLVSDTFCIFTLVIGCIFTLVVKPRIIQNWVQVKFGHKGQDQSLPKTTKILNRAFCTPGPNLETPAWTGDELWCGRARGWRTHTHGYTQRQTQATTILNGRKRPQMKKIQSNLTGANEFHSNTFGSDRINKSNKRHSIYVQSVLDTGKFDKDNCMPSNGAFHVIKMVELPAYLSMLEA